MNRGSQWLRGKEGMLRVMQEERGKPPEIECVYCEVATRYVVTRYQGPVERPWRGVPVGDRED